MVFGVLFDVRVGGGEDSRAAQRKEREDEFRRIKSMMSKLSLLTKTVHQNAYDKNAHMKNKGVLRSCGIRGGKSDDVRVQEAAKQSPGPESQMEVNRPTLSNRTPLEEGGSDKDQGNDWEGRHTTRHGD